MHLTSKEILIRLGTGESIQSISDTAGISRAEFDTWWKKECRRRVPCEQGVHHVNGLFSDVTIHRDTWGIPHIRAENDADLFFGFGYATAQDRLFQLDYARRKARGRLAEILGRDAVESDVLYRTINLAGIVESQWAGLPEEPRRLLEAYTAGVNAWIEQSRDRLPIEFDLLDYQPEPWSPEDSLAIQAEFCWYLTGRLPLIMIPELAKRLLGDGPLYRAFLQGEEDAECILPPGSYSSTNVPSEGVGATVNDQDEELGSNNWVVAGNRTATGKPLVSSDPHLQFGAVSICQEVVLQGGSFDVAGLVLAGMPGILIGRNRRVAWGFTNNICSLRDLYQEQTHPENPDSFLYDGAWETARQRVEVIHIRNEEPIHKTIRSSRNGPIVNELLPSAAQQAGSIDTAPVSLRWQGESRCGSLTALLNMNRAQSCEEFREATRPWDAPTFNFVFADIEGNIGLQTTGEIPIRHIAERGYRSGWDPLHQWKDSISFEDLPYLINPLQGFAVTANNRLAPDDYPSPLSGAWSSGYRARRIRELIEAQPIMTEESCKQFQLDIRSGRGVADVPRLVELLASDADPQVRSAVEVLKAWDGQVRADSVAATLFNLFFRHWCIEVTAERIPENAVEFLAANANGLATRLLMEDDLGWFNRRNRTDVVQTAFHKTLHELTVRFGPDMSEWTWGKLHTILQKHFLSGRGELGELLDRSGDPAPGDSTTICNNSPAPDHKAYLGPAYRMVADLADASCGLWTVEMASVSGHPGSPHYDDQFAVWVEGGYHFLSLESGPADIESRLHLQPKGSPC
ncbi:MAG TPA: penicillin acylase family protein [Planctomicrobium sp.]|nr:penicillin acylase family protein [Planctomicrobium sp.]